MKIKCLPLAIKAGLGTALAVGAGALPLQAQATLIVINTPNQPGQTLADGDTLTVTGTGSIVEGPSSGATGVQAGSGGSNGFIQVQAGGSINANGSDAHGIDVNSGTTITGTISNQGDITAERVGIFLRSGAIAQGAVTNSGTLTTLATGPSANASGILLARSTVNQGIANSGTVNTASNGILLADSSSVSGGITNSAGGLLEAGNGIAVHTSVVNGDIVNAGTFRGGFGIALSEGTLNGNILNQAGGLVDVSNTGIDITSSASVAGGIVNAGTITSTGSHAVIISGSSSVAGGITNSGTLNSGIRVEGSDGSGGGINLGNSGDIDIGSGEFIVSGNFSQTAGSLGLTLQTLTSYNTGVPSEPIVPFNIGGDALLSGGNLSFIFDSGFVFENNQRITLFNIGGSRSGQFANYGDNALIASFGASGLFIDYTVEGDIELYSADRGAGSVPVPPTAALFGLGMLGCWRLSRRKRSG